VQPIVNHAPAGLLSPIYFAPISGSFSTAGADHSPGHQAFMSPWAKAHRHFIGGLSTRSIICPLRGGRQLETSDSSRPRGAAAVEILRLDGHTAEVKTHPDPLFSQNLWSLGKQGLSVEKSVCPRRNSWAAESPTGGVRKLILDRASPILSQPVQDIG